MKILPKLLHVSAASAVLLAALPAGAAAPTFDTPAPVAFMIDLSSSAELYSKDADRRMPPASMAKMMTVYVVFDMLKKGELKADKQFVNHADIWKIWQNQGSSMYLKVDESVSVDNLLKGIVTLSANDACVVMAVGISGSEAKFTERMNAAAKKLGLTNSHFGTSNGWPDKGVTYSTARDLAKLAQATIRDFPDYYKKYYALPNFSWGTQNNGKDMRAQDNRDPLLGTIPGADGLKTGHTEESGYGFTGSAVQNGRRLIMVIAGLNTFGDRKDQSIAFMKWGFAAWSSKQIVAKGKTVATAEVQLGSSSTVNLIAADNLAMTYPAGSAVSAHGKVVYTGPLKAPIKAGDHIADLIVSSTGMPDQSFPLVADKDVAPAGFFGRAWTGLMQLFGG